MKKILLACALLCAPMIANAATLSFVGTNQSQIINGYNPHPGLNGQPVNLNGQKVDFITGDNKNEMNGLFVSGPSKVTFTYLGHEAGNGNEFFSGLLKFTKTSAVGSFGSVDQLAAGLIDFSFRTLSPAASKGVIGNKTGANPSSPDFAIGYLRISSTAFYVLFDDIARTDRDFDDFAMRVDVSPIPLPAGGFLLIGALGGLAALRRRKMAA